MQRKNCFLKLKNHSHRTGMAMIMAIAVLVVIATIMALSLSLTTQTSKRTTDLYIYEQSVLLSKSAAEYAMLKLSQDAPCLKSTIPTFIYNGIYTIEIDLRYIYKLDSSCHGNIPVGKFYAEVLDSESDGSVLMDITITADAGAEPIRYFRRTIQKL